jgi:hypothetical protein
MLDVVFVKARLKKDRRVGISNTWPWQGGLRGCEKSGTSRLPVRSNLMPNQITNDQSLREAIRQLTSTQQRTLAGQFVASVAYLSHDPRVARAIKATTNPALTTQELEETYQAVKAFATQTYTACGQDADWAAQAEHFVAAAAAVALSEENHQMEKAAWKSAMQARMAKNCEMIMDDQGGLANESEKQYQLAEAILKKHTQS